MKKNFQPASAMSAPAYKWPQALVLSVGLTGACMQAQAAEPTHITSDRTTELLVHDQEVFVAPGVALTISNLGSAPAVSIANGGVLHMEQGSKITVEGIGVHDGIWMQEGTADFNGASIVVDGVTSDALQMEGRSQANLIDTTLSAMGIDGRALLMQNNFTDWGNSVSVTGGSLMSRQAEAILMRGVNSTVLLNGVDVAGANAIHLAGSFNTFSAINSTMRSKIGSVVLMDGSDADVTILNTTVSGASGTAPTVNILGARNTFNMTGGKLDVTREGSSTATVSALRVEGGVADIRHADIIAKGENAQGVRAHSGADIYLEDVAIFTTGGHSRGVLGTGEVGKIVVSGGSITTEGTLSDGLTLRSGMEARVSGARIDIGGSHSNGVVVGENSTVDIRASTIDMTNGISHAAVYVSSGTGAQLTATHVNANAVGTVTGLIAAGGAAWISGGSIATENGLGAVLSGGADVTISDGAHLSTTGAAAHAIHFSGRTRSKVTVDAATVAAQHALANVFHSDGSLADVVVQNGATINTDGNLLNVQSRDGDASEVDFAVDNAQVRGNILIDSASTGRVSLRNGGVLTGQVNSAVMNIDSAGQWNVSGNSELTSLTLNSGAVHFGQPQGGAFKTVRTASLNGTGGRILMHATLGDGSDQADLLHVTGDAIGTHVLDVRNAGGTGAQTNGDGIPLIQADGRSDPDNFGLAGGVVQAGMYEYFLKQGGQNRANDWYLRSTQRAALPAFIMTPTLNRDYGYSTVGTLHERVGDLGNIVRGQKGESSHDGAWGRISGSQLRTGSSEQIDANARSSFMQFGKDWTLDADATGASTHAGATMTLGEMQASFSDEKRIGSGSPVGRDTGTAKTRAVGVGGYWTRYFADGAYVDAVGQLTRYGTTFKDAHALEANGKGTGVAFSVEAGKPFVSYGSLRMEAQGQMIYQYLRSDQFHDGVADIAANGSHALRGRAGIRVFREMQNGDLPRPAAPYAVFNVWRNFNGAASVGVDGQSLQTQTNKTWGEIGVGITGRLSKQGMLQASLKYRHQLGGLQFEGTAGEIGYRYSW